MPAQRSLRKPATLGAAVVLVAIAVGVGLATGPGHELTGALAGVPAGSASGASPATSAASSSPAQSGGTPDSSPATGSAQPSPIAATVALDGRPVPPLTLAPTSAHGQIVRFALPAPWTGGRYTSASVAVYEPPNFDPSGRTRYPVVYEAPYGPSTWSQPNRFNLALTMDEMIAQHLVPPELIVMMGTSGGPYLDSECANSRDGRSHIESWIVNTIVPWVDAHWPTVASRLGRATMGASQGGYCAVALWSHHPGVFGAAIVESGYFVSGVRSSQTPDAWRPFGGNAAYEQAQSPILVVPKIPAGLASRSLVLLEADPSNAFYGRQLQAFLPVLQAAGVQHHVYADPAGHSWTAFARDTPRMLVDLARWMAAQGVA